MNDIVQYLFEIGIGSFILSVGYMLLKNALTTGIKRFYLFICIFIPVILPALTFEANQATVTYVPAKIGQTFTAPEDIKPVHLPDPKHNADVLPARHIKMDGSSLDRTGVFLGIYFIVSLFLLLKLLIAFISILHLKKGAEQVDGNPKFMSVQKEGFTGASFFGWIFINKQLLSSPSFEYVLLHEATHKKQLHSLDILIAELNCIVFWINPVSWFIRKEVRLNTELDADFLLSGKLDARQYSRVLLALAAGKYTGILNAFSAMDTKRRIHHILNPGKERPAYSFLVLPFALLAIWLVSCEPELAANKPTEALSNIKTITTTYISHQGDTRNKDGKIIAIANFLPDGSVDKVTQHMSYPYNFKDPVDIQFWSKPNPENIPLILDGLGLGKAEYNFLYGNDWPKKYANVAKKEHPIFHRNEFTDSRTDVSIGKSGFPAKIVTNMSSFDGQDYVEEFEHSQENRVEGYVSYIKRNTEEMRNFIPARTNLSAIQFAYSGNELASVTELNRDRENSYHFEYALGKLVQSSYFVKDELYVTRKYYYNENGVKTRTEIFNVFGEPEYTIFYDYAYY